MVTHGGKHNSGVVEVDWSGPQANGGYLGEFQGSFETPSLQSETISSPFNPESEHAQTKLGGGAAC